MLEINGLNTGLMTHKEAQEAILSCGHQVPLTVLRQETVSPDCRPTVELVGPAPVAGGVPGATYTRTSLARPQVEEDHWDVRHNITAKGFQGAGGSGGVQPGAAGVQAGGVGGVQPSTGGAGGFRSVSAPITRPGAENRGPPPLVQGQTAYLLSKSGRQPGAAPPARGPPPPSDWSQRLNNNTAGMAMNAEDFTKEFMKQLTGGQ